MGPSIKKARIALLQGDACGIGPELMSKLLNKREVYESAVILVISDKRVFEMGDVVADNQTPIKLVKNIETIKLDDGVANLIDTKNIDPENIMPGVVSEASGFSVLENLKLTIELATKNIIDGICFTPFNKEALHKAGMKFEDELGYIRNLLGLSTQASEFNVVDKMWNARVTSHVPLKEVSDLINIKKILDSIIMSDKTLKEAGFSRPRIAVAALNPHAGAGGAIGREEIEVIKPAIEKAQALQISVNGPFPSDTMYLKIRDGEFDCGVSMYHDQGQIAIKLLGFDKGVTVLGGLPIPITTPAHGTAFDIVSTNKANVQPTLNAFKMVAEMVRNRLQTDYTN